MKLVQETQEEIIYDWNENVKVKYTPVLVGKEKIINGRMRSMVPLRPSLEKTLEQKVVVQLIIPTSGAKSRKSLVKGKNPRRKNYNKDPVFLDAIPAGEITLNYLCRVSSIVGSEQKVKQYFA
ncbi:hypothetical protein HY450_03170 [Candidatus Pacearchaeota archaeon]|nr:hypothetical protein [Candidatus Pacearchaeota archaeon]